MESSADEEGRLAGARAVVTGASSGIGAATARALVRDGARVALLARREGELRTLVAELGDAALAVPADVARSEDVARAFAVVDRELGGVDVLVNSAGVAPRIPLSEHDDEVWHRVLDTNLSGAFYTAREAAPRMLAGDGGTIVNVGSEWGVLGMSRLVAYCASKAGLVGLTKALARELAPHVRVNAVSPGPVETPMFRGSQQSLPDPQAAYERTLARVPLGRVATPEEIAAGIVYLIAGATYATGTVLHLDGGTTS